MVTTYPIAKKLEKNSRCSKFTSLGAGRWALQGHRAVIEANTKVRFFLSSVGSEGLPLFNRPYNLGVRNEGLLLFVLHPVDTAKKDRAG